MTSETYASVRDKANAGGYRNTDPYPMEPGKPELLRKPVGELSAAELSSIGQIKADYDAAVAAHKTDLLAWDEKNNQLGASFEPDLAAEHGLTDHPKRSDVYYYAYEKGHWAGHAEIASIYSGIVHLVK